MIRTEAARLEPRGHGLASLALLALATACATGEFSSETSGAASGGPVLPDTQTIDGVLVMRHGADAFARAPKWTLDTTPMVVVDGGEEPDFDLTYVYQVAPLSDGRFVAAPSIGPGRLMLFTADGSPARLLARSGEGPGDVMAPLPPMVIEGDTVVVIDGSRRRTNWFTADSGWVRSVPIEQGLLPFCFQPAGRLLGDRLVAFSGCTPNRPGEGEVFRLPGPLIAFGFDYADVDTMATLPGLEQTRIETRYGGVPRTMSARIEFGLYTFVTTWDSLVVVVTGEEGYVLKVLSPGGVDVARIEVPLARRAVTPAMREAEVARKLARLDEGGREQPVDPEETRRVIREAPYADSLPPAWQLLTGSDGTLWVLDYLAPVDSTWTATAFGRDGAILGRLSGSSHSRQPVRFLDDRVIVREVDGDGVVRFGVYSIRGR